MSSHLPTQNSSQVPVLQSSEFCLELAQSGYWINFEPDRICKPIKSKAKKLIL